MLKGTIGMHHGISEAQIRRMQLEYKGEEFRLFILLNCKAVQLLISLLLLLSSSALGGLSDACGYSLLAALALPKLTSAGRSLLSFCF